MALDSSGNVVVTGYSANTNSNTDYYTAKYAAADGAYLWDKAYGATGTDVAYAVATSKTCAGGANVNLTCTSDSDCPSSICGTVLVTGGFTSTVNFGGATLNTGTGGLDTFIVKLNGSTGATVWAKNFSSAGDAGYGIVTDSSGNVIIVGAFAGHAGFIGTVLTSSGPQDGYVVKLAATGAYMWAKQFGGTGSCLRQPKQRLAPAGGIGRRGAQQLAQLGCCAGIESAPRTAGQARDLAERLLGGASAAPVPTTALAWRPTRAIMSSRPAPSRSPRTLARAG